MQDDYIIIGEKNFAKRVVLNLTVIFIAAVLMTLFITFYYSGGTIAANFSGRGLVITLSIFAIIAFLFCGLYAYVYFFDNKLLRPKHFVLIFLVLLVTVVICCVTSDLLNVFVMPMSLAAVLLCVLLGSKLATAGNIILSQLILMIIFIKEPFSATSMSLVAASVFCNTLAGFILIYFVSRYFTRTRFILYSALASVIMAPLAAVVSLTIDASTSDILLNALWMVGSNLITVVLYMPILPLMESLFSIMTDFKLDELCNLSRPLLKQLSAEAPGTFNHSIIVGQMAEACALAIGEDIRLARAAAYYHDVGKMKSPEFFAENLKDGINPHDDLIPEVSVSMITKHTKDGAEIILENHLPEEIAKVALEHHGTTLVKAFYLKAQKITDGELKDDAFRYEGPKPTTKIAAIIMICDACEAIVRAISARSRDDFERLVDSVVADRLYDGQFDNCPITIADLTKIKSTIVDVLGGIHHARVSYK